MEERSIYTFVWIGLVIRQLRQPGDMLLNNVVGQVNTLSALLDTAELPVSVFAVKNEPWLAVLAVRLTNEETKDRELTEEEVGRTVAAMTSVEYVVFSEANTKRVFAAAETRYDGAVLLDEPARMFVAGTFEKLSDMCRFDFAEGFRCLALSRPTAAAFHMLRATEEVLRMLYKVKVKQKRVKLLWAPMVQSLRAKRTNKVSEGLLNRLDHIRVSFRNPTAHPEKVYDMNEAQDLLGLCVEVVSGMVREGARQG